MSKISVWVSTVKFIEALEKRLNKAKTNKADEEKEVDKYKEKYDKWGKDVFDWLKYKDIQSVDTNGKDWVTIQFTCPKTIPCPKYPCFNGAKEYDDCISKIENALSILKLTDKPVVNTETFSNVTKYL